MNNLYKDVFKNTIKVGDEVCIRRDNMPNKELVRGKVTKILSDDNGVRVEIKVSPEESIGQSFETGYIEYILRGGNIEYGTM